jgi:hypothetical protein
MKRSAVGLRKYRNRWDIQLMAGPDYPNRNFAPVGNKNFLDWLVHWGQALTAFAFGGPIRWKERTEMNMVAEMAMDEDIPDVTEWLEDIEEDIPCYEDELELLFSPSWIDIANEIEAMC